MSFVLNTAPKVDERCESPKLWRPGRVEKEEDRSGPTTPVSASPLSSPQPVVPQTGRTKEELYKMYETSTPAALDLSMKDLVERAQSRKSVRKVGSLRKIQESKASHGLGKSHADDRPGSFKWWTQNPDELLDSSKGTVTSKANGDNLVDPPRKSFGEYLEERSGYDTKSFENNSGNKMPPTSPRGEHGGVNPGQIPGSSAGLVKPTSRSQLPSTSPLRSPMRSPIRSPIRSPMRYHARSPLPPDQYQQRAALLASASSPARLGGYQKRDQKYGDTVDYTNPMASPGHWGNTMFSPSPSTKEYYAKESAMEHYGTQQKKQQEYQRSVSSDQSGRRNKLADELKWNQQKTYVPINDRTRPTNYCSSCSSSNLLNKTRCVACGKPYCRNCVAKHMRNLPQGRKCKTNCLEKQATSKFSDQKVSVNCWPFGFLRSAKKSKSRSAQRSSSSPGESRQSTTSRSTSTSAYGSASVSIDRRY